MVDAHERSRSPDRSCIPILTEVHVRDADGDIDRGTVPIRSTTKLAAAGVLLAVPIVALLWVGTYAKSSPVLAGFPFFIWYQFLWVFICSGCTWAAHRLVQAASSPPPSPSPRATDSARKQVGRR
jgi:hypothetical protein